MQHILQVLSCHSDHQFLFSIPQAGFTDARYPKHNMHIILNSYDALVYIITQMVAIFPAKVFLLVS